METPTNITTPTQFAIRPFRVTIPDEELVKLRQRIEATLHSHSLRGKSSNG